jgi:hypothetical protein
MWHPDPVAEQLMKEIGMEFFIKTNIPIKDIKLKESLRLNARPGDPADANFVDKYAYDMSHGATFPMPVITSMGILLAGVQRLSGAEKAGLKTVDSYVTKNCSDEQINDFVRRDNARHGKGTTEEERISQCVSFHKTYGRTLRDLCNQYFGGQQNMYGKLVKANEVRKVQERLLAKGIQTHLETSAVAEMHPIQDDNILCDVHRVVAEHHLNVKQVGELVSEVCSKGSEAERKAVCVAKRAELEHHTKTGTVKPENSLRKHLVAFNKAMSIGCNGQPFSPIDQLAFDKKQATEMKAIIDEAIASLKRLKEKSKWAKV